MSQESTTLRYGGTCLLYAAMFLVNQYVPDAAVRLGEPKLMFNGFLLLMFTGLTSFTVFGHLMRKQPEGRVAAVMDVGLILGVLFFSWLVSLSKLGQLDVLRFPSPNVVFDIYRADFKLLVTASMTASVLRLIQGYAIGTALAIPWGLVCGKNLTLHDRWYPIAKILAPIPPILFVPYALELLPTVDAAVIFVIFIGAFWPILVNTIYGVRNIDPTLIEAARTLGTGNRRLYWKILLPGALPQIYAGLFIGLVIGFIVLAVAEGIGGDFTIPGLGWYVLYFADTFDYGRIVAAILTIAFIVIIWTAVSDTIQNKLLRWQKAS